MGRTNNKTVEINPNACLLKSTTELVSYQKTPKQIKQILYERNSQRTPAHHGMRLGLALMTSSAIVQINIHDSTILV